MFIYIDNKNGLFHWKGRFYIAINQIPKLNVMMTDVIDQIELNDITLDFT